jgi:hypothetical protein
VELGEPGEARHDAGLHRIAYVGEDAGLDAGALQRGSPLDHRLVGLAPERAVSADQRAQLAGIQRAVQVVRHVLPVSNGVERATVIVVAVLPVDGAKWLLVHIQNPSHLFACGWVRRPAEYHTVVEEHSIDLGHGH